MTEVTAQFADDDASALYFLLKSLGHNAAEALRLLVRSEAFARGWRPYGAEVRPETVVVKGKAGGK